VAAGGWRRLKAIGKLPRLLAEAADLAPALSNYRYARPVPLVRAAQPCVAAHPALQQTAALPCNVSDPNRLDPDRGWWGFSMRDVPARQFEPTWMGIVTGAQAFAFRDPRGQFRPCLLTQDGRPLDLPELTFRPPHGGLKRAGPPPRRIAEAFWILERNYENHAHWLLSHLPKLCLWRERGQPAPLVLPRTRTPVIEASLRALGIDPQAQILWDAGEPPLAFERLHVVNMARLHPLGLGAVRTALAPPGKRKPWRRLYVSRARAKGRRYLPEKQVWPMLAAHGFERVFLEDFSFGSELALMAETAVLAGPVGAGLANAMFCAPGAQLVEIRDTFHPVPDFYGLSAALGLRHWLVDAQGVGEGPPLLRDLCGGEAQLGAVLRGIEACA